MSRDKFWVIRVPNWDTVNPNQKQQKKFFVLSKMHRDPQFLALSPGARLAFLWILGEVSTSTRREAWCRAVDLHPFTGRKPPAIRSLLEELVSIEWIQIVSGPPLIQDKLSKVNLKNSSSSKDKAPTPKPERREPAPAIAGAVVNPVKFYCDAYKARYQHSPVIGPKQAGILGRVAKSFPGKWQELITGYLAMPDSWAVQRPHPVELLESKLNEITRFLATGKVMTKAMTKDLEDQVDDRQETGKIDFGAVAAEYERKQALKITDGGER